MNYSLIFISYFITNARRYMKHLFWNFVFSSKNNNENSLCIFKLLLQWGKNTYKIGTYKQNVCCFY